MVHSWVAGHLVPSTISFDYHRLCFSPIGSFISNCVLIHTLRCIDPNAAASVHLMHIHNPMLILLWSREGSYPADSIEDFDKFHLGAQKAHFMKSFRTLCRVRKFTWTWLGMRNVTHMASIVVPKLSWLNLKVNLQPVSAHVLPSLCMFEWSIIYPKNNNCFGSKSSIDYFFNFQCNFSSTILASKFFQLFKKLELTTFLILCLNEWNLSHMQISI
jgi:hypothetical protein